MSTAVFPSLVGMTLTRDRVPQWSTIIQESVSGKETRVARRQYSRTTWTLDFDLLRSDATNAELQNLMGFFDLRSGAFDSFLFTDNDDSSVTSQAIGNGDGVTVAFPLSRVYGSNSDLVQAPNVISNVYLNGANQTSGWTASYWGSTAPGVITFASAPGVGVVVSATFTYYWPVRFADDKMTFSRFMNQMYEAKKVSLIQIL